MREWKPQPSSALLLGLALLVLAAGAAAYLLAQVYLALARPPEEWPIGPQLYLTLVGGLAALAMAGLLGYRVAAARTLRYAVDRNAVYIFWLGNRAVVPLSRIESIDTGGADPPRLGPLSGVGYYHGLVRSAAGRPVHLFSSVRPARALVLRTAAEAYTIAPESPDSFVQELEQRRRLGAVQQLSSGVEPGRMFLYAFWADPIVKWALLAAIGLNLALLGGLMLIYPGLPALVELRVDATGFAAALRPRHQILFLPLAAAAIGLLNVGLGLTIHGREPLGARLLQIGSAVVQALFIVAALTILV